MKKMMLVWVALLFSANFAFAIYDCEDAYIGTCLENVVESDRIMATVSSPNYPDCPIRVYYRTRMCNDDQGNWYVSYVIEWWEINKGEPEDCLAIYNDLWDPDIHRWDQVLYEQLLQDIDQELSESLVKAIMDKLPSQFFDCDNGQHFVHVTTTKTACYSPVPFYSTGASTHSGCDDLFIVAKVPCGDYGCCYEKKSYCRIGETLYETLLDSGYIPGAQSGCGETPPMANIDVVAAQINGQHTGCGYIPITFLIRDCYSTCTQ